MIIVIIIIIIASFDFLKLKAQHLTHFSSSLTDIKHTILILLKLNFSFKFKKTKKNFL